MFKLDDNDLFNFDDQEFQEIIAAANLAGTNKDGDVKKSVGNENGQESTRLLGICSAVVKKSGFDDVSSDTPTPPSSTAEKSFTFTPQRESRPPLFSPVHCVTVQRASLGNETNAKITPKKREPPNVLPVPNKVQILEKVLGTKTAPDLSPFHIPSKQSALVTRTQTPKRKFPGPAGLLPRLPSGSNLQALRDKAAPTESCSDAPAPVLEQLPSSQNPEEVFERPPWQQMKSDLHLEEDDPDGLLARFNIAWVLEQATLRQLPRGKVPVLCAILKSISPTGTEAGVILQDKTGQINGSLHRSLVENYGSFLQPGTVLVIQQASVLSPSVRRHYLNLTPSNLVALYSEEGGFRTNDLVSASQLLHQALSELLPRECDAGLAEEKVEQPLLSTRPSPQDKDHTDDLLEDDLDDIFRDVTEELPF